MSRAFAQNLAFGLVFAVGTLEASEILSPEESMKLMRLPEDYRLELVLADPIIRDPISICWDGNGKLYVVERRAGSDGKVKGRISRHVDTDNDGWMDRHSLFVDQLPNPVSIVSNGKGIIVNDAPNLWYFEDTSGNGKADIKTKLSASFGPVADRQLQDLPGALEVGIDNWIEVANHPERFRFINGVLTVQETISAGDGGISADENGRIYFSLRKDGFGGLFLPRRYCTTMPILTDRTLAADPILRLDGFRKARSLKQASQTNEPSFFREGRDIEFSSACGPEVFLGDRLDEYIKGDLFLCEPSGSLVRRVELKKLSEGQVSASNPYESTIGEFITSADRLFHPVHLGTGPDGCLYVVDMYAGSYEKHIGGNFPSHIDRPKRGTGYGRIYRIVGQGVKKDQIPNMLLASEEHLIKNLAAPNHWRRRMAKSILIDRGDIDSAKALHEMAVSHLDPIARIYAIWTLQGTGNLTKHLFAGLLEDPDPRVKIAAIRAWENQYSDNEILYILRSWLSKNLHRIDTSVLVQAILSLDRIHPKEAAELIRNTLDARIGEEIYFQAVLLNQEKIGVPILWDSVLSHPPIAKSPRKLAERIHLLVRYAVKDGRPESYANLFAWVSKMNLNHKKFFLRSLAGMFPDSGETTMVQFSKKPPGLTLIEKNRGLRKLIGEFRFALTWPGHSAFGRTTVAKPYPLNATETAQFRKGKAYYNRRCAACHGIDGRGKPSGDEKGELKPPPSLAANSMVEKHPTALIQLMNHGFVSSESAKMIPSAHLKPLAESVSKEDLAAVLTYIRCQWGNSGSPVIPEDIELVDKRFPERTKVWKRKELDWDLPGREKQILQSRRPNSVRPAQLERGVVVEYFPGDYLYIPSFDKLAPRSTELTGGIHSISEESNRFARRIYAKRVSGLILIEIPGLYTFSIESKYGSRLLLNGGLLADNEKGDSTLTEASATIFLSKGYYPLEVHSLVLDDDENLRVKYEGPGFSKQKIPEDALFHEPENSPADEASSPPGSKLSKAAPEAMKKIRLKGTDRSFKVFLPNDLASSATALLPALIYFGDRKHSAEFSAKLTKLNTAAQREGFVSVYPILTRGFAPGSIEYEIEEINFATQLLRRLERSYRIDSRRVYLVGFSEGVATVHLLASRLSHRFAAVATVAGSSCMDMVRSPRAIPVLHIHGTNDVFIPENGGMGKRFSYESQSVNEMLQLWVLHNQCGIIPKVENLANRKNDGCWAVRFTYPPARDGGPETCYIQIRNGGHVWPGSRVSLPPAHGKVCFDIDATDLIWDFVKHYKTNR